MLLEGARPDQEFPRIGESLDLIWGALRVRLRLGQLYQGNIARIAAARGVNLAMAGQLAVVITVVLRMRRLALAVIAIVAVLWIIDARYGFRSLDTFDVLLLTCYGLEAAALIASPGPRRGLQLLSCKAGAVLVSAAAALTVTWTLTMKLAYGDGFTSSGDAEVNSLAVLALVILAAGVFLFSHLGRYIVVLVAAMFCPYVLYLGRVVGEVPVMTQAQALAVLCATPVVAVGAVLAVAFRSRSGRFPGSPDGTTGIKGTRPT